MLSILYKNVLKPIFFKFDPEDIHNSFLFFGNILGKTAPTRFVIDKIYNYHGPDISKTVDGIKYRTPIILAGGFDKNGLLPNILLHVGFGGLEIGSITYHSYKGNDKPRLKRLLKNESIIVNFGLKNEGVKKIVKRLKTYNRPLAEKVEEVEEIKKISNLAEVMNTDNRKTSNKNFVWGINVAKTNSPHTVKIPDGIKDYINSLKYLEKYKIGDYYNINISCPNAWASSGEDFARPKALEQLLICIQKLNIKKPIYLKMPINRTHNEFNDILSVANNFKCIKGLVIGNLNKNYDDLKYRNKAPEKYCGGLSGRPCYKLSNDLIAFTKEKYKDRFTIIGVGGILKPEHAIEKLKLGADLVQLITGMIFTGPQLIKEISYEIAKNKGLK